MTRTFGFDIDGCLANLIDPWLNRLEKRTGFHLDRKDISVWELDNLIPPEYLKTFHNILDEPDLYDEVEPIQGGLDAVNAVRFGGDEVVFITWVTPKSAGKKFLWLQKHGFLPENTRQSKEYFETYGGNKNIFNVDVLIDDRYQTIKNFPRLGIVYLQPWNDAELAANPLPYVDSWYQFIALYKSGAYGPHITEIKRPQQTKRFREVLEQMYRVHLNKNADYCVHPDTLVLTSDLLWIPIKSVRVGMTLVGFDETITPEYDQAKQGRRMYRQATAERVSHVNLPSYKITLSNGDELISSEEHPWLAGSQDTSVWIETKSLRTDEDSKAINGHYKSHFLPKILDVWETDSSNAEFGMVDLRQRISVVKKEFLGNVDLVSIKTSTGTYIANGYGSHNSPANILAVGNTGVVTRLWDKTARMANLLGVNIEIGKVWRDNDNVPSEVVLHLLQNTFALMTLAGFRFEIKSMRFEQSSLTPKYESINDTFMDGAVYNVIGLLLQEDAWGK